jgi:Ras-related protein Rab-8A
MQVWDTAGQERFQTITQTYYKGSMGIILTYAVNDRESFKNIEKWMKQIKQHASENVCKILIGNKCDMPDRQVEQSEGKQLADSHGIPFFETSAKENINIDACFNTIATDIKDKMLLDGNQGGKTGGGQKLDNKPTPTKKEGGCC